jgi:hypothetical protein
MNNAKSQNVDNTRTRRHAGHPQPARLPQTTADLVNRMLAARCGASR